MSEQSSGPAVRIAHLYPELLNLYGDRGNVICLKQRCLWRGIGAEVEEVRLGDPIDFSSTDIIFIGGGSDREEELVCGELVAARDQLFSYVEDGGVLLAVCGGYQLLGKGYLIGDERVEGVGLLDADTTRGEGPRLVGDVAISSPLCEMPIVGYENHAGRTTLGPDAVPLGTVLKGHGNDGVSGSEGALRNHAIGTYLHGPLLPKNPQLADWLISRALERRTGKPVKLAPLPDEEERAANAAVRAHLGV